MADVWRRAVVAVHKPHPSRSNRCTKRDSNRFESRAVMLTKETCEQNYLIAGSQEQRIGPVTASSFLMAASTKLRFENTARVHIGLTTSNTHVFVRLCRTLDIARTKEDGMPQVSMTPGFVSKILCPDGKRKIDFFDLRQPGFMLEVRASGGKTFYQRYTDDRGRERQFRIGPAGILNLSVARLKGRSIQAHALVGDDPRSRRATLRSIPRLAELVQNRYLPHVKNYKRSWRTDETMCRIHILPILGKDYVDHINSEQITALVERMRDKKYASGTTNRVVIVLRHVFNLARQWRVPGVTDNPTVGIDLATDTNRERFLTLEEAQRLIVSIECDSNKNAANAIMLLLLTGARRNEITFAKWENLDLAKQTLLVPLSKSGKPRNIILNEAAITLFGGIKRHRSPFIFPSPVTGRPSPSLHFPWQRIRKRADLRDLRLHDLRHSFASFLVNRGVSLYVVQGLLGHSNGRYTQRYAHLAQDTLQNAAEAAGCAIADARTYIKN